MSSLRPNNDQSRIEPLSAKDIAQIKSSIAITSLQDVVLGLLCNSLDADATKIEVQVNFGRGSCTVEDNGTGIPATEFEEHGGLLKCYHSSKASSTETYGCNGAFLASVCAMSLLHIASRSANSGKTNSITAHHSKVSVRSVPAPAQEEFQQRGTGTKVTVRNLFGNMPVRVKHRAMIDSGLEDTEWHALLHAIVAYRLAWKKPFTVRIRNETTGKFAYLQAKACRAKNMPEITRVATTMKLESTLSVLTQASLIYANSWPSWVPISAKTSSFEVRGAISLDPCPTKQHQFIAIDIMPILHEIKYNELYNEINRLFSDSRFGVIEDTPNEDERLRRSKDRRFKQDGITNKQLKATLKSVDRWPMFDLHIDINENPASPLDSRNEAQEAAQLQSIIKILRAMIEQWLHTHGFTLRKKSSKVKRGSQDTTPAQPLQLAQVVTPPGMSSSGLPRSVVGPLQIGDTNRTLARSSMGQQQSADKAAFKLKSDSSFGNTSSIFQTWSRIKSSKSSLKTTLTTKRNDVEHSDATLQTQPQTSPIPAEVGDNRLDVVDAVVDIRQRDQDVWTTWQDPNTRQMFNLNTRSGLLVPAPRSRTAPATANTADNSTHIVTAPPSTSSSLRLESRSQLRSIESQHSQWLKNLVTKWDNPVFLPAEQPVEHISLEALENTNAHGGQHTHIQDTSSLAQESRLSATYLCTAKVIAQLDNKFILIKMSSGIQGNEQRSSTDDDLLVIVDQHAADERCKVEALLSQLCSSTTPKLPLRSNLGHQSHIMTARLEKLITFETSAAETDLLKKHAGYFAKWGVLYDVLRSRDPRGRVTIHTLPPVILERCVAEPRLIIEIIRSEAWQRDGTIKSKHLSPTTIAPTTQSSSSAADELAHTWLRQISDCPRGILEMIKSRACRSAIMFNDVLTNQECRNLLDELAKCAFPFMCAHGRPSMVPLVSLSTLDRLHRCGKGNVSEGDEVLGERGGGSDGGDGNFVDAFRRWRQKKKE